MRSDKTGKKAVSLGKNGAEEFSTEKICGHFACDPHGNHKCGNLKYSKRGKLLPFSSFHDRLPDRAKTHDVPHTAWGKRRLL